MHPVLVHPEDELGVLAVPAAFSAVVEQGCRDVASEHVACRLVVFVREYVDFVLFSRHALHYLHVFRSGNVFLFG